MYCDGEKDQSLPARWSSSCAMKLISKMPGFPERLSVRALFPKIS
jgi:hypothetical protein